MGARFSRDDWIILGLAQLASDGFEGLRLDALCAAAGRTRGSFYHHFDDLDAYLDALWDHWGGFCAADVLDAIEAPAAEPDRWALLARLADGMDPELEAALRRAAAVNAGARAAVRDVDAARVAHLTEILAAQENVAPAMAEDLARLEYAAFIGARQLFHDAPTEVARLGQVVAAMVRAATRGS